LQGRLFFPEHGRDLPFRGPVDARVGPALFPLIEVALRLLERFEAQALQRCFLRMADAAFHLALAVGIAHPARQCDCAVMLQHVLVQRVDRWIVDVGLQHAFAQVIEDHRVRRTSEPREGSFVQFRPDARARLERQ
jgi:hypothetical protein